MSLWLRFQKQLSNPNLNAASVTIFGPTCEQSHPLIASNLLTQEEKKDIGEEIKEPTGEKVLEKITLGIAQRFKERRCREAGCGDLLVVDDNEFNRFILVQILTKYGFYCKTVPMVFLLRSPLLQPLIGN